MNRLIFILLLLPNLISAQEISWSMATPWPGGPIFDGGPKAFSDRLKQLSGGRLKIEPFQAGVLGNALQVTDTVRNGVAQCGHGWGAYDWGKDKTGILFGGYAGSLEIQRFLAWLYEDEGVALLQQWRKEKFGLISFPLFMREGEVFLHSKKPVRTLADLKGLKIRTSGAWLEITKDLGASPIVAAGGDVFPMLERGVIDATEWGTLSENFSLGFHRIAKYLVVPGSHQPTIMAELMCNERAWKTLTEQDRRLIQDVAKLVTIESWMKTAHADTHAFEEYKKAGNEIIYLDDASQKEIFERARAWAESQGAGNEWFKKVLASQMKFEARWAGSSRYRTPYFPER